MKMRYLFLEELHSGGLVWPWASSSATLVSRAQSDSCACPSNTLSNIRRKPSLTWPEPEACRPGSVASSSLSPPRSKTRQGSPAWSPASSRRSGLSKRLQSATITVRMVLALRFWILKSRFTTLTFSDSTFCVRHKPRPRTGGCGPESQAWETAYAGPCICPSISSPAHTFFSTSQP